MFCALDVGLIRMAFTGRVMTSKKTSGGVWLIEMAPERYCTSSTNMANRLGPHWSRLVDTTLMQPCAQKTDSGACCTVVK